MTTTTTTTTLTFTFTTDSYSISDGTNTFTINDIANVTSLESTNGEINGNYWNYSCDSDSFALQLIDEPDSPNPNILGFGLLFNNDGYYTYFSSIATITQATATYSPVYISVDNYYPVNLITTFTNTSVTQQTSSSWNFTTEYDTLSSSQNSSNNSVLTFETLSGANQNYENICIIGGMCGVNYQLSSSSSTSLIDSTLIASLLLLTYSYYMYTYPSS